ncbi:MAG: archaellin/type IV pilin N-terminal domain-containing protein, partial [Candidatus Aenigmatarchaeota archaeon]
MQTKAISAVIATVMLLMITVSLIGVFYVFSSTMASQTASSGGEQVSQLTAQLSTCVRIDNMVGSRITVTNCGTGIMTNGSLAVFVDEIRLNISMNTIPGNGRDVVNITDIANTTQ